MRHLRKHRWDLSELPILIGFDEEEEDDSGSEEENSEEEEEDNSESEDDDEEEEEDDSGKDVSGLKSALNKERKARKTYEKELKELRKFKEELENADKSEKERAEERAEKAEKALADAQRALQETRLNSQISELARKARFRDIDDALRLIDRSEIEADDEGNFDKKAVEKAVKALADSKPHLVLSEGEESAPSGSKFGGKKKSDKKATEKKLKDKYPALGR